jgi:hypothetical protein
VVGLGPHEKGRAYMGDMYKTQNIKAFDIPTPEELMQKL